MIGLREREPLNDSDATSLEFFPIEVEQNQWAASKQALTSIRHQVFIEEQAIPEADEFDDKDSEAIHWLAYGPENVLMGTARLVGDKVGRMAVLKPYRKRGVGSALMRRIIRYAAQNGLESIQLDAQMHAIPFYESMKFESSGPVFTDVGIAHQHMTLALKHFLHPRVTPPPADISEEERSTIPLNSATEFCQQANIMVQRSHRHLRIFSHHLDPNIYDNDEITGNIFRFARQHPYAEVHILVQNPRSLVQNGHRLLQLYHRLPSRLQIRTLNPECKTSHTEFMIIDHEGILYNQTPARYIGYALYYSPINATELANEFDEYWNASEPDPEMRQLPM